MSSLQDTTLSDKRTAPGIFLRRSYREKTVQKTVKTPLTFAL